MSAETPRPGDQPLPMPSTGPGMHDLVIADLTGKKGTIWPSIIDALADRRDVGLERYGQPLQRWNGRDAVRDLFEECLDAVVYARQVRAEATEDHVVEVAKVIERDLLNCIALTQLMRMANGSVEVPQ